MAARNIYKAMQQQVTKDYTSVQASKLYCL